MAHEGLAQGMLRPLQGPLKTCVILHFSQSDRHISKHDNGMSIQFASFPPHFSGSLYKPADMTHLCFKLIE